MFLQIQLAGRTAKAKKLQSVLLIPMNAQSGLLGCIFAQTNHKIKMGRFSSTHCDGSPRKTRKDKQLDFLEEIFGHDVPDEILSAVNAGIVDRIDVLDKPFQIFVYYISNDSPLTE